MRSSTASRSLGGWFALSSALCQRRSHSDRAAPSLRATRSLESWI
jgi:hypothetical protein